jgi:hypothetical protein
MSELGKYMVKLITSKSVRFHCIEFFNTYIQRFVLKVNYKESEGFESLQITCF